LKKEEWFSVLRNVPMFCCLCSGGNTAVSGIWLKDRSLNLKKGEWFSVLRNVPMFCCLFSGGNTAVSGIWMKEKIDGAG
jgi:hypothetical protein